MNKKPYNEHTEMNLLASTKDKGGMNAIDIGLHARSLFVYPITKYIQYKVMQNEIPNYMQWLKNKIGEQITRKLEGHNINIANSLYRSSNVYNQMLSTYFNVLRITEPCMNPNQVYLKAIENSTNSETNRILREHDNIDTLPAVHNAILPNNIKEFNYKLYRNELAILTKTNIARRAELGEKCVMCKQQRETLQHLFYRCMKIKRYWFQINEITNKILNRQNNVIIDEMMIMKFKIPTDIKQNMTTKQQNQKIRTECQMSVCRQRGSTGKLPVPTAMTASGDWAGKASSASSAGCSSTRSATSCAEWCATPGAWLLCPEDLSTLRMSLLSSRCCLLRSSPTTRSSLRRKTKEALAASRSPTWSPSLTST